VTFERFQQAFAILCVPYADNTIVGTRSDLLPIWGIGHTADPALVAMNTDFILSCDYIHHHQSTVIATGCYEIVNRRERNSTNLDGS
jgi:hypothetical protein